MTGTLLYSLLLMPFLWGLKRGGTICLFTCGSAAAPFALKTKSNAVKEALKVGASRAAVLGVGGAVLGVAGHWFFGWGPVEEFLDRAGAWTYLIFGLVLMGVGVYWMAMSGEPEPPECSRSEGRMASLVGALGGLACLGETVISLEGVILAGIPGMIAPSFLTAGLVGGVAMTLFAVGSFIPAMAGIYALRWFGERSGDRERVRRIGTAALSVLMMGVGSLIMWRMLPLALG